MQENLESVKHCQKVDCDVEGDRDKDDIIVERHTITDNKDASNRISPEWEMEFISIIC